jgi:hypothetical protein
MAVSSWVFGVVSDTVEVDGYIGRVGERMRVDFEGEVGSNATIRRHHQQMLLLAVGGRMSKTWDIKPSSSPNHPRQSLH